MNLIMEKWLQLCYSAMMFKEKKKTPKDWIGRIAFLLNFNIFFILSAVIFNVIILIFGIGNYNRIILFLIAGVLAYFSFILNDKNIKKYILIYNLPKTYVKKSQVTNFISLVSVIIISFSMFLLFIYSFKMQNYL